MTKVTKQKFLYCKDVMEILDIKESLAYRIIKKLNKELEAKGYYTQAGRVSQRYFEQRYYITEEV